MRVSVASDLHLEFHDLELPGGDMLLLCGDTFVASKLAEFRNDAGSLAQKKRYRRFCREELRKYDQVLAIAGNHEFYGGVLPDESELIRDLLSEFAPNATWLDNQFAEIDGVRFVGSTLWATYGYGTAKQLPIQRDLNDFSLIWVPDEEDSTGFSTRKFNAEDANRLHQEALDFLMAAMQTDLPCVVFTHHAPTYLACNRKRFPNGDMDDAYASNQSEFILNSPNIRFWFSGHSHYRFRAKIAETKVASNPRGYYGYERMSLGFDAKELDWCLETFEFLE